MKASGQPFVVHTPSNDHLVVAQQEHISKLANAPLSQLSLHAVAKEVNYILLITKTVIVSDARFGFSKQRTPCQDLRCAIRET